MDDALIVPSDSTTASLAKCTKTLPVLLVGYFIYSAPTRTRQWVASVVMAVGCGLYLSTLRTGPSPLDDDDAFMDAALGLIFLSGELESPQATPVCTLTSSLYYRIPLL